MERSLIYYEIDPSTIDLVDGSFILLKNYIRNILLILIKEGAYKKDMATDGKETITLQDNDLENGYIYKNLIARIDELENSIKSIVSDIAISKDEVNISIKDFNSIKDKFEEMVTVEEFEQHTNDFDIHFDIQRVKKNIQEIEKKIEELQEQWKQVDELKKRIQELRDDIENLKDSFILIV